jgi:hypothetical protein
LPFFGQSFLYKKNYQFLINVIYGKISHRNPIFFFFGGGAIFYCFFGVDPHRNAIMYGDLSVILLAVPRRAGHIFKPETDQVTGKSANNLATSYSIPLLLLRHTPSLSKPDPYLVTLYHHSSFATTPLLTVATQHPLHLFTPHPFYLVHTTPITLSYVTPLLTHSYAKSPFEP